MEVPPGCYVDRHWVLGGIDLERGMDKICLVPQQNSATLIPIVQQYVRHGTTIYADLWGAYSSLGQCGYVHGMVNRSCGSSDQSPHELDRGNVDSRQEAEKPQHK